MEATINEEKIEIYIDDILKNLSTQFIVDSIWPESQLSLIERLSCKDIVIKHVVDQILGYGTENGFSGCRNPEAKSNETDGLDWACREIAKRSSEVAAKEIKRLEEALQWQEIRCKCLIAESYELRKKLGLLPE